MLFTKKVKKFWFTAEVQFQLISQNAALPTNMEYWCMILNYILIFVNQRERERERNKIKLHFKRF